MRKILLLSLFMISSVFMANNSFAQEQQEGKAYHSFGGHVFTDEHFPITLGFARLYKVEDAPEIFETVDIDTLGYYYFYRVPEGQYFVDAGVSLGDPNYHYYAPTLFPNTTFWDQADTINLNSTSWEYDIHLFNIDSENQGNGPGYISGNIQIDNGKPYADNVNVMLLNEEMECIMHWPTNSFGEFSFEDLAIGNYILYPQVIGLTTQPISIHITETQSQFDNIEITIKDGFIASFINEDIISAASFMLYPNPSSDFFNIHFETYEVSLMSTRIYDLSGRLVYEVASTSNMGVNIQQINTSEWQSGYYFCDILVDGKSAIRQKFAVVR